jgi:hypothetical protein
MDNMFRIKKARETVSLSKNQDVVSGTLDSVHQNIVVGIREVSSIDKIMFRIQEIEEEIKKLKNKSDLPTVLNLSKLDEEHKKLTSHLEEDTLKQYYLKNADIMMKYYGNTDKAKGLTISPADQNTFIKYLSTSNIEPDNGIVTKKQLFDQFTARMKMNTQIDESTQKKIVTEHCEQCNIAREELSEEGILVCPKCGSEEYMLVISDFPSFRDPPKERNNYAYKKINHLNEILNQFQAKESTIIPDEVMNEIICEIKKRRIRNVAELTEKDMREILKKLNRSKYYEHATHILSRLNGNPPPTITPEIEEKIRTMFQEIQAPFLLYCPDDRTNFLSYSYILYKFFELLDLDEYKVYFPLLKSRDRLIAHDQIWKKICDYLKWEFIRSV